MRAARLHAYGKPLALEDIPEPKPGPGQVVVKIEGAGFCPSDLHVIDGEIQTLPRLPLILGHENAGVVAALGKGVESVREGDRVAVVGAWGCGRCDDCVTGPEQLCAARCWAGLSQWDGWESIPLEHAPLEQINAVHDRLRSGQVEGRVVITP